MPSNKIVSLQIFSEKDFFFQIATSLRLRYIRMSDLRC